MAKLRVFTFVTTLVLVFKKIESNDKTKYDTFYSNSKPEIFINENDNDDVFKSIYTTIYIKHTKIFMKRFRLDFWFSCKIIDSVLWESVFWLRK